MTEQSAVSLGRNAVLACIKPGCAYRYRSCYAFTQTMDKMPDLVLQRSDANEARIEGTSAAAGGPRGCDVTSAAAGSEGKGQARGGVDARPAGGKGGEATASRSAEIMGGSHTTGSQCSRFFLEKLCCPKRVFLGVKSSVSCRQIRR